ncbi:zinc-dependent alcohol dehydrogenase [Thioalkalivibrio sp.]|uniref:zinc-dependent alcohol dehydrogenase n=1 Tax=Thioalkalivibrio sp. TaxID=2093813 RepID=UPI003974AAF1
MATDTARAFWILEPGTGAIRTETLSPPEPGEVVVETMYSGISRGTETLVFAGRVPPSQYQAMRAPFQSGEFPGPVKYGYISVGRIVEGPASRIGERVFCLYPHQDRYRLPEAAAIPLPSGLPAERAILAANMETAVNALWDARPLAGDRIAVIGGGVLGMLTAWLCRQVPGTEVTLVDINAAKGTVAAALGLGFQADAGGLEGCDLVIHASGQPAGLVDALRVAGREGTILELSWYGDRAVPLPLGEDFHARRLVLRSTQVGQIPAHRQPRWDYRRRMDLALRLLCDGVLDILVTGESRFEELPEALAALAHAPGAALCHRIRYP